jgi:hypothetical protein
MMEVFHWARSIPLHAHCIHRNDSLRVLRSRTKQSRKDYASIPFGIASHTFSVLAKNALSTV